MMRFLFREGRELSNIKRVGSNGPPPCPKPPPPLNPPKAEKCCCKGHKK